jgi:hypothetical protein
VSELGPYPRLIPGPGTGPALDWENDALLFVLQASQGLLAPDVSVKRTTRLLRISMTLSVSWKHY